MGLEQICTYIQKTELPVTIDSRYSLSADTAINMSRVADKVDAVALAFYYGRAKGYRAAIAEMRKKGFYLEEQPKKPADNREGIA